MGKQPASPAELGALSHLAPELAQTFASVAGDIALVVDVSGVIRNVAVGSGEKLPGPTDSWIGQRWEDTVSPETRGKIDLLLQEAVAGGVARSREVNLPMGGVDVPVAYAAVRLGEYGPVLAVGRDLRAVAAIQQRFIDTQQQMEREYWKKRQAESRYRMLFHVATDAVLVVDAQTLQVGEANRAATQLFGASIETMLGRPLVSLIDLVNRAGVEALLLQARKTGLPAEARARTASGTTVSLSAVPFRSDDAMQLRVRARRAEASRPAGSEPTFAELVERIPDAVVITDGSGRILMANPAFVEMSASPGEEHVTGVPLSRWLGRSEQEVASLLDDVRRHGIAPQVTLSFRAGDGQSREVDLSAAMLTDAEQESIGFTLRQQFEVGAGRPPLFDEFAHAVQRLARQMGQVPLPGLLREVTDLAERHLIAAAVERGSGDLAVAAAFLGVSEHSLQLRLRRHGLLADGDQRADAGE